MISQRPIRPNPGGRGGWNPPPGGRWLGSRDPCVAVHDFPYVRGRLHERTTDWYSQDQAGNVWYFGEATAELDVHGHVKTREGSWQAGRAGARAGIFMPAQPRVGQSGLQEYL